MIGQRRGNAAWDGDRLIGLVRLLDDSEYIEIMPEESKNAAFYQWFGFKIMEDGVPMQLCNFVNKNDFTPFCLRITAFQQFSQWFPLHSPDAPRRD